MAVVQFEMKACNYNEFFVFVEGRQYLIAFRDEFTGDIKVINQDQYDFLNKSKTIPLDRYWDKWLNFKKPKENNGI